MPNKDEKQRRRQNKKRRNSSNSKYLVGDKYLNNLFKNGINVVKKEIKLNFTDEELIDLKKMCFNVMKQHIGSLCYGKINNKGLLRTELKILCRKTIKEAHSIKNC